MYYYEKRNIYTYMGGGRAGMGEKGKEGKQERSGVVREMSI